jgi:hypothetical protein
MIVDFRKRVTCQHGRTSRDGWALIRPSSPDVQAGKTPSRGAYHEKGYKEALGCGCVRGGDESSGLHDL